MSEVSAIFRELRPRTLHKRNSSQKHHQDDALESENVNCSITQMDARINFTQTLKGNTSNNNGVDVDINKDNVDVNRDDNDEADTYDDEPKLTIKKELDTDHSDDDTIIDRKYECKSCTPIVKFSTLVEYLQHLKDEHQQKSNCYECPHCNFMCQHSKRLTRHILTSHKAETQSNISMTENGEYYPCSICSLIALDQAKLNEHYKLHHLKRRFFRCIKCSYMTHVRARYTKHVKYHSMPMIKCDDCDFRTPYKWNLDRHTRNHGGGGAFQCRACNFTADIRQSLTVHETNHHEPPIGQTIRKMNNPLDRKHRSGAKRYNQVGASDFRDVLKKLESTNSINPSKSPMQIEAEESAIENTNAIAGAECIALKCEEKGCYFITAWDSEMQRHLMESHAPLQSPNKSRKPIPMLIPLSPENKANSAITNSLSSTLLNVPRVRVRPELAKIARDTEIAKLYNNRETVNMQGDVGAVNLFKKRNAMFFDKIKEKLMTSSANTGPTHVTVSSMENLKCWCTFEASSMEELFKHKMTHHTALSVSVGISHCPNCKRRCKSLTDLQVHMQVCQISSNYLMVNSNSQESNANSANRTAAASHYDDFEFSFQGDWDESLTVGGPNSSGSSIDGTSNTSTRRVFKCPHCPFWASTASRFHVHIVGHLNRKPFECSLCQYRSNWRWDITKHIKLKAARDPLHSTARVLMTDETGRRNYSKYNKYLAQMDQRNTDDPTIEECSSGDIRLNEPPKKLVMNDLKNYPEPPRLLKTTKESDISTRSALPLQVAKSQGQSLLKSSPTYNAVTMAMSVHSSRIYPTASTSISIEETKRTLWKCKRCNFRDANKEIVLLHVKSHYDTVEQRFNEKKAVLDCNDCPFTANNALDLAIHQVHHRPNLEAIFKCYLCPYYVSTKAELLEHARLHGEKLAVVHRRSDTSSTESKSSNQMSSNDKIIKMDVAAEEIAHVHSKDAVKNATTSSDHRNLTPPLLLDTRSLPDTPLVWVSRADGTFAKMLKCRHCPHVSSRRAEVRDHEIMHTNASGVGLLIACPDCSFSCGKKEIMNSHAEMHMGSLGTVHCLVDDGRTDAQQLDDLTTLLGLSETPLLGPEPDLCDSRLVHCCAECPARFLCEKELRIHMRYHSTELAYSCEWCTYAARQPAHLLAHQKAHCNEYQERSRYLLSIYGHSQRYPPPRTACVETCDHDNTKHIAWIVVEVASNSTNNDPCGLRNEQKGSNQVFTCAKCPARYFKLDALEYHMTLHGSNNRFQCSECDYSSKTAQNLMKHQVVHKRHTGASEPIATTHLQPSSNLQINPFIRGNPNFIHPSHFRNGRLKERRYKCHKCPSAFEKREQYRVHLTLHGAKQRYRCDACDYSVKYYANYVQHLKKHKVNTQAEVSRRQLETNVYNNEGIDAEGCINNTAKTRRKSTIFSTVSLRPNSATFINTVTIPSISNQDIQSDLLTKKRSNIIESETYVKMLRCYECPFSTADKDTIDAHKRRHGLERLIPSCPHCNYVPRKDENIGEHIRLHFTRLYKPESYLVVELLSLTMQKFNSNKKDKQRDKELLFSECGDGKYLPVTNASSLPMNGANGHEFQEKVIVDPNTGETTHHFNL